MGCGSPQREYAWVDRDDATGQQLNIQQGPMPPGQNFTGVYRSPQIGDIEMVQTGDSVVGRYEYDRGSCHVRARIEGSATGNLLRFNWREDHRECGRIAPVIGRGFFLYHIDRDGDVERPRILGRWGYNDDDRTGGPWTAFKQRGRQPTMQSGEGGDNSGSSGGDNSGSSGGGDNSGGSSGGGDNSGGSSGGGGQQDAGTGSFGL